MRSVTVVLLLSFIGQAFANELSGNHAAPVQDSLDSLADKIVDKLAGKVNLLSRTTGVTSRSLMHYNPHPLGTLLRRTQAPARSVAVGAELNRREAVFTALAGLAASASSAGPAAAADAGPAVWAVEKLDQFFNLVNGGGGQEAPRAIQGSAASLMAPKDHGTCIEPVETNLRWKADRKTADKISCYNRFYAEFAGYFEETSFLSDEKGAGDDGRPPVTFYDSVTGKPLFIAPQGRSWADFEKESKFHGWPSFRDNEVVQENVRVLTDGETVSVDGTHLGHNLPDNTGNRYCINLVSVAGRPLTESNRASA